MTGRLIPWAYCSATWNMAIDEALLLSYMKGCSPMTLRFYGWEQPTLSWGCFQKTPTQKVFDRCQERKISWVRRPTGGRAVLHQDEITYSLVAGEKEGFFGPVLADYQRISKGMSKGFALLGLAVEMMEKNLQHKGLSSQACFASPSWYELTYQGRKLVGSAQLRKGTSFLQHGSILNGFDAYSLLELISEEPEASKEVLAKRLEMSAVGLKEALGYDPEPSQVISALARGLSEVFGVEWEEKALTKDELELAKRLEREKYSRLI